MKPLRLICLAALLAWTAAAGAAETTVKLAVENMTCASCPYIVRDALRAVPGVLDAEVSYEEKTATVTFDDSRTSADALTNATANAGYPAHVEDRP